jgi:hypothetical protein
MNALDAFTIDALADWVQAPDDEEEGKVRAFQAMAVAGKRGQMDALLAEVIKPRKRVCRRCEGEGLIGDGYVCQSCDGTGFDR